MIANWMRRDFWPVFLIGWGLTALFGSFVLDMTDTFLKVWGAPLWAWPIVWPTACGIALLASAIPWTEEAKINLRIRAVERETLLLEKRRQLEVAEARYREQFDRYVTEEPETPAMKIAHQIEAMQKARYR